MVDSVQFYRDNAADFVSRTVDLDVTALYEMFLPNVPAGGRILDAGCGSGRDSLAFKKRGFAVTAFDASPEMVQMAREYSGLDVQCMRYEEMDYDAQFEGIWNCASLLHVPQKDTEEVVRRCIDAMVPGGCWFLSYKHGDGESIRSGRLFNNHTEESLRGTVARFEELELVQLTVSHDTRINRDDDLWLNAVAKRRMSS